MCLTILCIFYVLYFSLLFYIILNMKCLLLFTNLELTVEFIQLLLICYIFSRVYQIHWERFAVLGSLMSNGISCNLELGYFFVPSFSILPPRIWQLHISWISSVVNLLYRNPWWSAKIVSSIYDLKHGRRMLSIWYAEVFCNFTVVIVDSYGKLLSEDVSLPDFFWRGLAYISEHSYTLVDLNWCC